MSVRIMTGDCRSMLKTLADESVHCVVTSPPYFGLRDYGVEGQIGVESAPYAFVAEMVAVFRDVRRVLRSDGTLWLNLGDSYAGSWGAQSREHAGKHAPNVSALSANQVKAAQKRLGTGSLKAWRAGAVPGEGGDQCGARNRDGIGSVASLKPKDLMGLPWRVAFALQADGWWLRQDIIWSKPNPMPESVTDRCTKAHEYLFLLTRSERYFYDADAIREQCESTDRRVGRSSHALVDPSPRARKGMRSSDPERFGLTRGTTNQPCSYPLGRNKRSVWEIATNPYADAHFATFPPALIEPCILAGCPKGGTVLDPFGGAGTTGLVADRLQRSAILIELNPAYVEIARRRIECDAPLFSPMDDYNGHDDLARSYDECLAAAERPLSSRAAD